MKRRAICTTPPQIKAAFWSWLQQDCGSGAPALPPFLRNKLAQGLVGVVQSEYPAAWPAFFHDLIAAADQVRACKI